MYPHTAWVGGLVCKNEQGDEMGSIVDTRTPIGKPSFLHFFAMPSADIQKLLVKAYEKQIEALIEHEVRRCYCFSFLCESL